MKTKKILIISTSILVLAAFSALIVQADNEAPAFMNVWIDAPLDGMTLPLAPYEVVSHANGPSGISQSAGG